MQACYWKCVFFFCPKNVSRSLPRRNTVYCSAPKLKCLHQTGHRLPQESTSLMSLAPCAQAKIRHGVLFLFFHFFFPPVLKVSKCSKLTLPNNWPFEQLCNLGAYYNGWSSTVLIANKEGGCIKGNSPWHIGKTTAQGWCSQWKSGRRPALQRPGPLKT